MTPYGCLNEMPKPGGRHWLVVAMELAVWTTEQRDVAALLLGYADRARR